MKTRLKVGDNVKIICGKDRGKTGKITSIDRANLKVVVESCNLVKKVIKARTPQEKSKIISKEAAMAISNVILFVGGVTSRTGIRFENNEKKRYLKKNGENI
ncbi:50S ribosomal protein L24 [Candidatus Borreliella tachyglossi]|uniref:Large ribosomal subunit protein uL24 n=1 Tax=Candidatus Borreliella tachyglossi TaxID=1964448 RepID=A0A2S1LX53_9SPIR|nr:50S ribosomal protein L24 [Candidatus Borreliella tachyglossi]AWG42862.1 50S ribosomal protein L24 [Candidatus Borreliella tachyglossi]